MTMPKDPVMLLSFVNTQLRDHYTSLAELAASYMVEEQEIVEKLATINYRYDEAQNKFV
ncbi:MAG: DUF4250 domain-containing protein [Lachnospiraceae bacterium]|nr:DUF4250 domain-containing protein [Lachnospiraceae bacterium]